VTTRDRSYGRDDSGYCKTLLRFITPYTDFNSSEHPLSARSSVRQKLILGRDASMLHVTATRLNNRGQRYSWRPYRSEDVVRFKLHPFIPLFRSRQRWTNVQTRTQRVVHCWGGTMGFNFVEMVDRLQRIVREPSNLLFIYVDLMA